MLDLSSIKPDVAQVSTSIAERNNLTVRMGMRRFTRLTKAFSKKAGNLEAAAALHRVHQSLSVTPAVEAGKANNVWTVEEIAGLLDKKWN